MGDYEEKLREKLKNIRERYEFTKGQVTSRSNGVFQDRIDCLAIISFYKVCIELQILAEHYLEEFGDPPNGKVRETIRELGRTTSKLEDCFVEALFTA